MISHRHDDLTSAERSVGGRRYNKSVRLETEHRDISCGIAAREQSVGGAPGRKRKLDVLIALQGFFGGNDHPGTPMDAAYGPVPSTMDSDSAAGGALHQLRGVLRECEKGAAGFDHNCLSKIKSVWPRYGSDAKCLLLARWPGSGIGVDTSRREARPPRDCGPTKSPASHEGAQRCGRLFEVKNRPRANPVRGLGGRDRDRGM